MSRDCNLSSEHLEAHLDGELSGGDRRRVKRHVANCATCRAEVEAEQRLRRDFASLPELPCPDAVTQQVLARTSRDPEAAGPMRAATSEDQATHPSIPHPGRGRRQRLVGWVGAAAAVLLAALLAFGLADSGRDDVTDSGDPPSVGDPHRDALADADAAADGDAAADDGRPTRNPIRFVGTDPREADDPAAEAALQARIGLVVAARTITRVNEHALAGAFSEQMPRVLRESLSIVLDRPTPDDSPGGRG